MGISGQYTFEMFQHIDLFIILPLKKWQFMAHDIQCVVYGNINSELVVPKVSGYLYICILSFSVHLTLIVFVDMLLCLHLCIIQHMESLMLCMQIILNPLFHTKELLFPVQITYRCYKFLDEDFKNKTKQRHKNNNNLSINVSLFLYYTAPVLPGAYQQSQSQGYGYMHQTSMSSMRSVHSQPHPAGLVSIGFNNLLCLASYIIKHCETS